MESMIVPLVNVVLMLAAGIISIPWLRDAVEVSRTVVTEMPPNSNAEAEQVFLELLEEAETEIMMYDDGDVDEGSLYQSPKVVEAIKAKLQENSGFRVRCVLNGLNDTLFKRQLTATLGVDIQLRRSNPSRVHYKIIDGLKAYVSCHQPGEGARNRRMIDCTNAPSRRPGRHPLALQRYVEDFERHAAEGYAA